MDPQVPCRGPKLPAYGLFITKDLVFVGGHDAALLIWPNELLDLSIYLGLDIDLCLGLELELEL